MKYDFDPAKSAKNVRERGLPFEAAAGFDLGTANIIVDRRRDYGEVRFIATGFIGTRLHVLCYTRIEGGIRVISLRKANQRERKKYEKEQTPLDE